MYKEPKSHDSQTERAEHQLCDIASHLLRVPSDDQQYYQYFKILYENVVYQ